MSSIPTTEQHGIYVAEIPYRDRDLGPGLRRHSFLMLGQAQPKFRELEELHFKRAVIDVFSRAAVLRTKTVPRLTNRGGMEVIATLKEGPENDMRALWDRAVQMSKVINAEDFLFIDFKKAVSGTAIVNCRAAVVACVDAMGLSFQFNGGAPYADDLHDIVMQGRTQGISRVRKNDNRPPAEAPGTARKFG